MLSFLTTVSTYLAILLLCSMPAVIVARRDAYHHGVARRFLLAGAACGLVCGLVVASSNELIKKCQEAGNTLCFDAGASGMVIVVVGVFLVTSVVKAYLMVTE